MILERLAALNFKRDLVIRCINGNKHNHITTSYYLLLKKEEQSGQLKASDFKFFDDTNSEHPLKVVAFPP